MTKEPIQTKTTRELVKEFIIRVDDTTAAGGHTSISKKFGKTWAYQFKKENRPKKNVEKKS